MEPLFYHINVSWAHDHKGIVSAPELKRPTSVIDEGFEIVPREHFAKGVSGVWTPEHLFTASVSSCFMTTFLTICDKERLPIKTFACTSTGKQEILGGISFITEILVEPVITIDDETERDKIMKALTKTISSSFISNSIRAKVIMRPVIQSTFHASAA